MWQRDYNEDSRIYVSAVVNQDMTTGWSSAGSPVTITPYVQYTDDDVYDLGSPKIGTLIGSITATYRIQVANFVYPEDKDDYMSATVHDSEKRPQFTL